MKSDPTKRKKILVFLDCLMAILLFPFALAALLSLRILSRYAGKLRPGSEKPLSFHSGEQKSMSQLMIHINQIPSVAKKNFISRFINSAINVAPFILNSKAATAGFIYPYTADFEPLILESRDGTPLCGLLGTQGDDKKAPAILVIHDFLGSKNSYFVVSFCLKAYYEWGFNVLALDMRNSGDSLKFSDAPTSFGYRESDDILSAAEYLSSIENVTTVGALGVGLGASSAIIAASMSEASGPLSGGVIAINPHAETETLIERLSGNLGGVPALFSQALFRALLAIKSGISGPKVYASASNYASEVSAQYYELSEATLFSKSSPLNFVSVVEVPCLLTHLMGNSIVPPTETLKLVEATSHNSMVSAIFPLSGGYALNRKELMNWLFGVAREFFTYWGVFLQEHAGSGIVENEKFGTLNNHEN
ncbi:MAG: hypothetical protein PHP64_03360 [Actinomycetota bacterium]|nr:hypothetical protein [Actinomycetota bacterium]